MLKSVVTHFTVIVFVPPSVNTAVAEIPTSTRDAAESTQHWYVPVVFFRPPSSAFCSSKPSSAASSVRRVRCMVQPLMRATYPLANVIDPPRPCSLAMVSDLPGDCHLETRVDPVLVFAQLRHERPAHEVELVE